MNERLQQWRAKLTEFSNRFSKKQKMMIGAIAAFLIISATLAIYIASRPNYVPLFSGNLTEVDVAQIKTELDGMGYTAYKLEGSNILVPEKDKYNLAADLTAKGVPKGEGVRLDIFSQNIGMGMTDRQFDVVERDAMQTQLSDLLKTVDGVRNAKVILTMPEESVFVQENAQKATASIVVDVDPGKQLAQPQINALYNLVSKSVPNLPKENVVIMNQYSEMLDPTEDEGNAYALNQYEEQRKIKKDIENDIQKNLQNMLGTILGRDKVFVYPYVKLNFDKTQRESQLVEPVDKENNEGIIISAEKIQQTYTGKGAPAGGTAGTGETQIPGYPGAASGSDSEYEKIEDRVNREVNRIKENIVGQPYKIEDITINVGVEPPTANNPASLTEEVQNDIKQVIGNVVRASLSSQGTEFTQEQIDQRVKVFAQAFNGKQEVVKEGTNWTLIIVSSVIGLLLIAAIVTFIIVRKRRQEQAQVAAQESAQSVPFEIPELKYAEEGEEAIVRKQLEKLAGEKPEEFVNLLRTWLADE
ncbi:flagellar basal-body MS-ring/collar protein FliF [Aneurinibacillus sp. REN35]|uniref:flagellar basal-body MS-ring/collar protein FliF n=1 Tax=Aneurinibacillus sp. REN35 TaxID=3237286 RepID=UPI003527742C